MAGKGEKGCEKCLQTVYTRVLSSLGKEEAKLPKLDIQCSRRDGPERAGARRQVYIKKNALISLVCFGRVRLIPGV